VWALTQCRGDGHRCSLVKPERVLSEYNEDLIFLILMVLYTDFINQNFWLIFLKVLIT